MRIQSFSTSLLKYFTSLLLVAVPLAVGAQTSKDRSQAKKLQEQADKAFQQKNYREALDKYSQAIVLVPNNPSAHYRKGVAHFSLKENELAVGEFTLALNQGFKPLDIYRSRSYVYLEQKNYDAAWADVQKGLQLAPNDLEFLTALGQISIERNSYAEALQALQKVAHAAPNNADIQYHLARVHSATGNVRAQAEAAEAALAKGTRFPGESFYLLGDSHQKLRNPARAIEAYQKSINAKPNFYQVYRSLAEIFRSENRFNDAIGISKEGLKIFPNDGTFYTDLSWYYSLAGRPEDAVQAAKAGIQLLPNQYVAYTNLCRAYNETRNFNLAVSACNSALRLQPDDGETYYYLGNAAVEQGKSSEATRLYAKAVVGLIDYTKKNPDYSDGWYLLGNALFAHKQFDRAIDSYLKCLSLSPKFLKARVNLGISYTRKKNRAAAMEQYNLLLTADPALAARVKAEIDRM